ncbi:MAG TPA: DUF4097 family beta strand repeat-containing protein [Steroidobacteraceae bacterium]|nr:DUF4097 family beta strand repeat-containing protein [Steroidobacteraceae bacterium]
MSTAQFIDVRPRDARHGRRHAGRRIAVGAAAVLLVPWSLVHAGRSIQENRAADPQGEVEIVNVSGVVEIDGWDRSEVEVSGTAGDDVERVDVTGAGNRTSIHVVSRSVHMWSSGGEAHLVIHVPAKSSVMASLISADCKVMGVLGDLKLQSVSGNLRGDAGGNVRATSVSGDVRLTARGAKAIEVKTISGDIHLTGGGGEVDITTVSGSATVDLAEVTRGRFKTVSGDITAELALPADGRIESESVSGSIGLNFASAPAAEFDVQSFSGDIRNCFGPKPVESRYGPGSRLQFKNGEGSGRVRINTKSGDVRLCVKGMSSSHAAAHCPSTIREARLVVPYVF